MKTANPRKPPRRSRSARRRVIRYAMSPCAGRAPGSRRTVTAIPQARDRLVEVARAKPDDAVAARRQRGVVGDKDERHRPGTEAFKHDVDDPAASGFVEIAGRLVGDEDRGVCDERTGERNALLFAT